MADFIGIDIQGYKQIADALKRFPDAVQDVAVDDVSKYIIDVLRIYPPRKRITRRQAYGRAFQTDKQRRYFFWALHTGRITVPYNRTQTLRRGWRQEGRGTRSIIVNETPYAEYVMGEEQSRMSDMIGWEKVSVIPYQNRERIDKILYSSAMKTLKKLGLRT